jgi:hypothetical protein
VPAGTCGTIRMYGAIVASLRKPVRSEMGSRSVKHRDPDFGNRLDRPRTEALSDRTAGEGFGYPKMMGG